MGGRVIVDPRPLLCEIFLMHHEKISENVLDSQDSCCPLNLLVEYCRLSATMTALLSVPQAPSSLDLLGPIRVARPGNPAGMHAICGVLGQNNPGTDAGKGEWLIH